MRPYVCMGRPGLKSNYRVETNQAYSNSMLLQKLEAEDSLLYLDFLLKASTRSTHVLSACLTFFICIVVFKFPFIHIVTEQLFKIYRL